MIPPTGLARFGGGDGTDPGLQFGLHLATGESIATAGRWPQDSRAMAEVRLQQVEKTYARGKRVLHELDLTVRDEEFLVLVGPSGCGKSTILRIIAGLEDVTGGRVWIGDRDVTQIPPRERDIAMVFQNYALYPHLTARENLAFGLKIRRRPKAEIDEKVDKAARLLGIEELLRKLPKALSGGERQRVALGRAIVRDPQVFLFDEPLSNLDAKLRSEMRAEISALHRRLRVTTVYVTHDQVEAMTMGQRIVVLNQGIVQQIGEPLEVYHHPRNRFVAGFIGNPSMNFFEDTRADGGTLLVNGGVVGEVAAGDRSLPSGRFVLGVRPEDLRIDPSGPLGLRVTLVEPTGGESYVYGATEGRPVIIRAPGSVRAEIGSEFTYSFDITRAHFFDVDTEERIES